MEPTKKITLHKKFIKGLYDKYALTEDSLQEYIENRARRSILKTEGQCVCGHKIINARYLEHRDGTKTEIDEIKIGNCCITQFTSKEQRGKHCEKCKGKHNNRLDNLCNTCRKVCTNDKCNNTRAWKESKCYACLCLKAKKEQNNNFVINNFIIKEYTIDF